MIRTRHGGKRLVPGVDGPLARDPPHPNAPERHQRDGERRSPQGGERGPLDVDRRCRQRRRGIGLVLIRVSGSGVGGEMGFGTGSDGRTAATAGGSGQLRSV